MEFRLATPKDREQVEALWAYCFEPKGHPFFEWYFANCYKEEDILVGVEHDQVLADVHLRQYELSVRGKSFSTSYIVGLATHPAARRSGVGGELLFASLKEMRRRKQAINILMPSKAGFYQPYGWSLYCHQWKRTMPLEELRTLTDRSLRFGLVTSGDQWELLAPVYEEYTKGLNGYSLRDEASWRRLIEGQLVEGNIAVVLDEKGAAQGYLFYQLGAPTIVVSEFIYTSRQGQKSLLNYIYNHRSQGEQVSWQEGLHDSSYISYPDGKKGNEVVPYMTARIVDVELALKEVPVNPNVEGNLFLKVADPLAVWNEGLFHVVVKAGLVTVEPFPTEMVESTVMSSAATNVVCLGVDALALLLMGRLTATQLSFEGLLQGSKAALEQLDALYPMTKNFINEWY